MSTNVASCHCGSIRIEIPHLPETVTECNCSICRRYGARWAYYTRDRVRLSAGPARLASYSWGDRTIAFHFCTECGCLTHYDSTDSDESGRFAVNARMLPLALLENLPVRHFDGAESWEYID